MRTLEKVIFANIQEGRGDDEYQYMLVELEFRKLF